VVGERQIHGQVREAFKQAEEAGAVGRLLGALFRQSMRVAKRARVETDLDAGRATMVDVGLQAAERALGDLGGRRALIVGAGQMGAIAAERLAPVAASVTVTNRTGDRAEQLAAKVGAVTLPFAALREGLAEADLVLTSTGAGDPVIGYADVEAAMAGREGRRLALLDLAVPRDVDQACAGIPGVTVLDVDAVRTLTDAGERGVDVRKARAIVEEAASSYAGWTRTVQVEPTVRGLRARAEEIRQAELARLESRLGDLDERQRAAVDTLTRGIVNTLLHEPTVRLKRHADHRGAELYATALAELFDLPAAGDPTALPSAETADPDGQRAPSDPPAPASGEGRRGDEAGHDESAA
ncbi:MAG: glutamyl-tRNA reductase, partial [Actinomycetota bacterium]